MTIPSITVITATIGRKNLDRLIHSIDNQTFKCNLNHVLVWDNYRDANSKSPEYYNGNNRYSLIRQPWVVRQGLSPAGALYSMAMMGVCSSTEWIAMADDDVWWEPDHLEKMFHALQGLNWGSTLRNIWSPLTHECIGIDNFESVGDDPSRLNDLGYEMCDSNTMIFKRELAVYASPAFRETLNYDGDRLLYSFMKEHGGKRARTGSPTINQVCPEHLNTFFNQHCLKI